MAEKLSSRVERLEGPDVERFFAKVVKGVSCWNWAGATRGSKQKRGCFWNGKKNVDAARWIFAKANPHQPIDGLCIRHKCDNPLCVNPEHLEIGTQADNVADMWARNRGNLEGIRAGAAKGREALQRNPSARPSGERHGLSKLTEEQVAEIRRLNGTASHKALGEMFGVHSTAIGRILRNQVWKGAAALKARGL